jgi:hypothetical protein
LAFGFWRLSKERINDFDIYIDVDVYGTSGEGTHASSDTNSKSGSEIDMSKRNDPNPVLPLNHSDLSLNFNGDSIRNNASVPQSDRYSVVSSATSQGTLPTVNSFAQAQYKRSRTKKVRDNLNSRFRIPKYFKRMLVFNSLDFETAFWEMINLIHNPKRVYKSLYYQKQTKNKWARDDPSFVLILCFLLTISAVFWGLMYTTGVFGIFKLILYMVIVDFILVGIVVSTIGWVLANKFLLQPDARLSNEQSKDDFILNVLNRYIVFDSYLEWSYCFDVHCNAYLIIWLCLYFVQFFVMPVLRMNNIISTVIGNTLYFFALSYYCLITFYGYNALPFLHRTEFLLVPILGFVVAWFVLSILGINLANVMCKSYFD